ncbi:glycosyltransferase 4 family protein [Pyrococcus sp. ST04]|uniref:MraY family glycosyltransferase n=1 Tax=Pyrococcus sp. ST04 TaxID=1183377 RepID=UPI0002605B5D|nr:glycosyltransferase 4 family protein [Pyrococcus sp. ST04]AFK22260.1 UDP-N-acetylglucosamine-dolichyl-phosphate N-AceGluNH-phosphotransferase [Pyrococcus sp. ST04]
MFEVGALLLSLVLTKYIAAQMKKAGIVGVDVHKLERVEVPEMGGLAIVFTITLFALFIVGLEGWIIGVFLLVALVGIIDDLTNLRQSHKVILTALATFPLIFHISRESIILGNWEINLGILTLIIFWIYVVATANLVNMLAGFNGLEVGSSVIIFFFLYLLSHEGWAKSVSLIAFFASLGFLYWNKYPAKVFPGDTGTLSLGALMGLVAVYQGLEFPLAIMLIPHAIDFILKLGVKFQGKQLGRTKVLKDGTLVPPPYLSFLGLIMRVRRVREWELVGIVWVMEVLLGIFALLIY